MNTRHLLSSLFILCLYLARPLAAAEAEPAGYKVMVDVTFDEAGAFESAQIAESEDFSGEQILNQIALKLARQIKQAPQMKDGKPVKFTVRAPFNFPIEGDEGFAANQAPRPSLHGKAVVQPVYPAELAARSEGGGAILELIIGADGSVKNATVLRATHKEFAESALVAVKQWPFTPAMKAGAPVESRWRLAVSFVAGETDVDWQWRIAPRPSLGGFKVIRTKIPPPAAAEAKPAAPTPEPAK